MKNLFSRLRNLFGKIESWLWFRKKMMEYYFLDRETFYERKYFEKHHKSFGKNNRNKIFFVVRKWPHATGLLSIYLSSLGQIYDLERSKKDYIPVEDMQTRYYEMIHDNSNEVGRVNAWEKYFKNFSNYSMNQVLESKHVVFCNGYTPESCMVFFDNTTITKDILEKWYRLNNKYFKLLPELENRFDNTYNTILKGKKVIGAMIREDYILLAKGRDENSAEYKKHPGIGGHPVQLNPAELAELIEEKMLEYECDYIFIVCETDYVINIMREKFGDKLLFTDRERIHCETFDLLCYRESNKRRMEHYSIYNNNVDYLEEIYLLSKCSSLFASKCSGSMVACLWNNGTYEKLEIINRGIYSYENKREQKLD